MKKTLLIFVIFSASFGCGENTEHKYDRFMSELEHPVILIGKTEPAVQDPSITVRDGRGRVRTFSYCPDKIGENGSYGLPAAIAQSRHIGDTLK